MTTSTASRLDTINQLTAKTTQLRALIVRLWSHEGEAPLDPDGNLMWLAADLSDEVDRLAKSVATA